MDPASAAGIGLAVVGLAGQCFSGAMKALELIATARGLKKEYRYLSLRLRLEQQRCYNWASACGLLAYLNGEEDALNENLTGLNRTQILEVLIEVETLVIGFIKQKDKYGTLIPDSEAREQPSQSDATYAAISYDTISTRDTLMPNLKDLWPKLPQSVMASQLPKRVKWAFMDREKYERLISRLKELNDVLLSLVDSDLNKTVYTNTHETKMSVLQLHNKVDDLDQFIKALLPAVVRNNSIQFHEHTSQPGLPLYLKNTDVSALPMAYPLRNQEKDDNISIARLAQFKASTTAMLDASTESQLGQPEGTEHHFPRSKHLKIDRASIHLNTDLTTSEDRRTSAVYHKPGDAPVPVWIEWKPYQPADSRLRPSSTITERIDKLVALLADPTKPESLRVPTCMGYFDDGEITSDADSVHDRDENDDRPPQWRFGLVFRNEEAGDVLSLHDLLKSAHRPSLTRRIILAQAIATSLLSLHAVNWLHKGLRSSNIVFLHTRNSQIFTDEPLSGHVRLEHPLLAGFDYARPADSDEQTEHPTVRADHIYYRHPDSHGVESDAGEKYVKSFDIYSLGVILTEIALWQPASSFLRRKQTSTNAKEGGGSTRKFSNNRDKLLNDNTITLGVEGGAGERFAKATRICLEGKKALGLAIDDDESTEVVGVKLQRSFHSQVVRRLDEIQI